VAVIARHPAAARRLARLLDRGLSVRLIEEGDFDFRPGLVVTHVAEARGLEFDHVIVPDASPAVYPDTAESRRALYVAVTRPLHQLALFTVGRWTPILATLSSFTRPPA
jgi:DNA helicase-2/ATP-dependent DNA helicase PcrA